MPVTASNPFKWHHCPGDIILWCVRAPEVSDLICAYGRDGARTWSADPLQLYLLCVARRWPVPLATLFNGEPVGDETGGGHVVTVNGDYLRGRLVKILVEPPKRASPDPARSMIDLCHDGSIPLGTPFGLRDGPRQSGVVAPQRIL